MRITNRSRALVAALTLGAAVVASSTAAGAQTHLRALHPTHTRAASASSVDAPAAHLHRLGTHRGQLAHAAGARYNATSTNWAGYAVLGGGTYNNVQGTWVVPAVNCSWGATGASSTWVGIDGDTSNTVEQLGTHQDCLWGGASYHPWYELFPSYEVSLPSSYQVFPGDTIHAWVQYNNVKDTYWFHMQDLTRGWVWNLTVLSPTGANHPTNISAEWINEQPSCFYQCSWLSNYGTVTFTEAEASHPNAPLSPITSLPFSPITQIDGSGNPKQVPSAVTNLWNGSRFSVRFVHS